MRKFGLWAVAAIALIGGPADAGTATATATVSKVSPLKVITTAVTADCTWAPGAVVMTMGTTGGDGKAVTYTLGGTPTGDFAISGNSVVVGPSGIAAANCNTVETLTINATQL